MQTQLDIDGHVASLSEQIATTLRVEILAGRYQPGERLPSERDLAQRFEASRGAIREALKKLDQLGIAAIRPGGARVVAIESCTLDVLGPLLDLHEIPDPKLVDEVFQVFGLLMDTAARAAIENASDEQIATALSIIDQILADDASNAEQHQALRRLSEFYIDVADHLVLRLIINGLKTSFLGRMQALGIGPKLDDRQQLQAVNRLRAAVLARDPAAVGVAMRRLNRLFRDSIRVALRAAQES